MAHGDPRQGEEDESQRYDAADPSQGCVPALVEGDDEDQRGGEQERIVELDPQEEGDE